jgi:hypothetical protein
MDLFGSGQGSLLGCCEYNNQPADCIKMQGMFWLAGEVLASQEGFSTIELDSVLSCVFFIVGFLQQPDNYLLFKENSALQS